MIAGGLTLEADVLVVIGRPTFDLPSAAVSIDAAVAASDPTTVIVADGEILLTPEQVSEAMLHVPSVARSLILLFASFADSRLAAAGVDHFDHVDHVVLWSLPEQWRGGRLLRNSLCGANLAAHRLRRDGHDVVNVHEEPGPASQRSIERRIIECAGRHRRPTFLDDVDEHRGLDGVEAASVARALDDLRSTRLGVFGDPPDGFEPCEVDADLLPAGVCVEREDLCGLFEAAERPLAVADEAIVSELRDLPGSETMLRSDVERSVGLQRGAARVAERRSWNALAIRCWPECFDEFGGAACAAMAGLNDDGLPAACEADVFGALSMRLMQSLAGRPAFLADLVDVDVANDRLAFWHCGVAPPSLADPEGGVRLEQHPNRQVPLVYDFGIVRGPITIARLSQGPDSLRLVVGEGHVIDGQPFVGTSCVMQLATSARSALDVVFDHGLEHHFALVPGHYRRLVEHVAADLGASVIRIS